MSSDEKDPLRSRSSKIGPSLGGLAKSGVNFATSGVSMASDGVASVVKPFSSVAKASGKAVTGTAKTLNPTKLFKKSKSKARKDRLYEGLQTEAAEDYLLQSLEEKRMRTVPNGDGFRPAMEGERAPLGLNSLGNAFDEEAPLNPSPRPNYRSMARMAHEKSQRFQYDASEDSNISKPIPMNQHQRVQSLLESINDTEDETAVTQGDETFPGAPSEIIVDESHPLIGGGMEEDFSSIPYQRIQEIRRNGAKRRCQSILACLNPCNLIKGLFRLLVYPFLVWAIPFFTIGWILFYYVGNPSLDFLPGEATISWWLNFFGRQIFLLQIAFILQTCLIDWTILSSRLVLAIVGPWATIFCLQSRGWPFLVGTWGLLAMVFLHGDDAFSQHWLHFTGIKIFTVANSGSYIINSSPYLRVLIGMLLAGIATSLKRTIVTLYFGKRSFDIYKTKLEKILNNVILVSEVAELAAAADEISDAGSNRTPTGTRKSAMGHVRWSSLRFEDRKKLRSSPQTIEELSDGSSDTNNNDSSDSDSDTDGSPQDGKPLKDTENEEQKGDPVITEGMPAFNKSYSSLSLDTSVKHFKMKNQLGRWDDPLNKMDKHSESSVSDILKFRKALTYMDLEHPFSESFGPASNRDELLTSAQAAYTRLLVLSEGATILPFSVLAVLVENEDGTIDKRKRKSLKKIFPADRRGNVSLFSFVMGCDTVYKKLRYFRASVGNSSVIDKVLEDIVDTLFFFVLIILILSLLNLNPWPLLVSTSTLMVTFAFALGPSAAKAIEGMILIVGRRPYDIGDRIIISDSPGGAVNGAATSWFVEDITLFSTTLRFGANNEIATVGNGSIAQSRITNCARSKKATIHLTFKFHLRFHEGSNLSDFREALDAYVLNNPNRWDSIVFFRCEEIDTDNMFVNYRLAIRSTQSWQPAPRVLEHRAQLHRFCTELANNMEVDFNAPIPSSVIYQGGEMQDVTHPKVNRAKAIEEALIEESQAKLALELSAQSQDSDSETNETDGDFERVPLKRTGGS